MILTGLIESANSTQQIGVDRAIRDLIQGGILSSRISDQPLQNKARSIIFTAISWICMLYSPSSLQEPYALRLDREQACQLVSTTKDIGEANLCICETIKQFGSLLPEKPVTQSQGTHEQQDTLLVSQLNFRTLSQIGKLKIRWISNISTHLTFDPEEGYLMIFALPSFCFVNRYDHRTLTK